MVIVRVQVYDRWEQTYIIPTNDINIGQKLAYKNAQNMFSCSLPKFEDMLANGNIEILSGDAEFILINDINS